MVFNKAKATGLAAANLATRGGSRVPEVLGTLAQNLPETLHQVADKALSQANLLAGAVPPAVQGIAERQVAQPSTLPAFQRIVTMAEGEAGKIGEVAAHLSGDAEALVGAAIAKAQSVPKKGRQALEVLSGPSHRLASRRSLAVAAGVLVASLAAGLGLRMLKRRRQAARLAVTADQLADRAAEGETPVEDSTTILGNGTQPEPVRSRPGRPMTP